MAELELLAGDPALGPLWVAIHQRLCAGAAPDSLASVRVHDLTAAGLAELRGWLDRSARRRRGSSAVRVYGGVASVPVRELRQVLTIDPADLVRLVEAAVGTPVVDRRVARAIQQSERDAFWWHAKVVLARTPRLVERMRVAGPGDLEEAYRLVDALGAALARLPADPPVSLAKLAHDTAGDPHFFDLGTLPGQRLVAGVAELAGLREPKRPDQVRALLAGLGLYADRLWATVLLLNVATVGDSAIDRRLRESRVPVPLTLLDLTHMPPRLSAGQTLTVVENPSVLEAALACGSRAAFACTSGQLRAVDHALLQLASQAGLELRYAGDLDPDGLQIADSVVSLYGAELVAMDAAVVHDAARQPSRVPLPPGTPARDPELAEALGEHGRVVFQESDAVLRRLLPAERS